MKKNLVVIIALLSIVLNSSCSKTNDGPRCPVGYDGANCEVAWNLIANGAWKKTGTGVLVPISASLSDPKAIDIKNLINGYNFDVVGNFTDSLHFTIQRVMPGSDSSYEITTGNGQLDPNGFHITGSYIETERYKPNGQWVVSSVDTIYYDLTKQ